MHVIKCLSKAILETRINLKQGYEVNDKTSIQTLKKIYYNHTILGIDTE